MISTPTKAPTPKIGCVANWFGTDRTIGPEAGRQLGKLDWCGIPFCGGLGIVQHINARTILANDLHRHIINLARVIADATFNCMLAHRLSVVPFHPEALAEAQAFCRDRDTPPLFDRDEYVGGNLEWAAAYFVTSWMSRAGSSGTDGEFNAGLATRWTAGGGDSNTRYRNAVASLDAWRQQLARCTFECMDGFEFIERILQMDASDKRGKEPRGIYVDAPFPGPGKAYTHQLTPDDQDTYDGQYRLAGMLNKIKTYRVAVRYYDDPLIRDLYPEGQWTYLRPNSKTQANKKVAELLLINSVAGE